MKKDSGEIEAYATWLIAKGVDKTSVRTLLLKRYGDKRTLDSYNKITRRAFALLNEYALGFKDHEKEKYAKPQMEPNLEQIQQDVVATQEAIKTLTSIHAPKVITEEVIQEKVANVEHAEPKEYVSPLIIEIPKFTLPEEVSYEKVEIDGGSFYLDERAIVEKVKADFAKLAYESGLESIANPSLNVLKEFVYRSRLARNWYINKKAEEECVYEQELIQQGMVVEGKEYGARFCMPLYGDEDVLPDMINEYEKFESDFFKNIAFTQIHNIFSLEKGKVSRAYLDQHINDLWFSHRNLFKGNRYAFEMMVDDALRGWTYPIEEISTRSHNSSIKTLREFTSQKYFPDEVWSYELIKNAEKYYFQTLAERTNYSEMAQFILDAKEFEKEETFEKIFNDKTIGASELYKAQYLASNRSDQHRDKNLIVGVVKLERALRGQNTNIVISTTNVLKDRIRHIKEFINLHKKP